MKRLGAIAVLVAVVGLAGASSSFAGEIPIRPFGRVESSGGYYIQVDGAGDSPLGEAHPWATGYVSVGSDGVCAGGENDHAYYADPANATAQDCNEALADEENQEYITDQLAGG